MRTSSERQCTEQWTVMNWTMATIRNGANENDRWVEGHNGEKLGQKEEIRYRLTTMMPGRVRDPSTWRTGQLNAPSNKYRKAQLYAYQRWKWASSPGIMRARSSSSSVSFNSEDSSSLHPAGHTEYINKGTKPRDFWGNLWQERMGPAEVFRDVETITLLANEKKF